MIQWDTYIKGKACMQPNPDLKVGTIVQIHPRHKDFGGDFLVVKEILSFGIQGYLALVYAEKFNIARFKGVGYLRVKWEDIDVVGEVGWLLQHKNEDEMGYQNDSQSPYQDDRSK
jgi:hypothetical protein